MSSIDALTYDLGRTSQGIPILYESDCHGYCHGFGLSFYYLQFKRLFFSNINNTPKVARVAVIARRRSGLFRCGCDFISTYANIETTKNMNVKFSTIEKQLKVTSYAKVNNLHEDLNK